MKQILKAAVARAGYEIRRPPTQRGLEGLEMLAAVRGHSDRPAEQFVRYVIDNLMRSSSQIFQDLFVLHTIGEKRGGYFVEFGAADGEYLSNTVLLERELDWTGILSEPGRNSQEALGNNRRSIIDQRCVWKRSGETVQFAQNPEAVLSTIVGFENRQDTVEATYDVETVSLTDLLMQHGAPTEIDYLSIDTEGSELSILSSFDFSRYCFKVITVEHNYGRDRESIFKLLTSNGYERLFPELSMFDDWYVHRRVANGGPRG